MFQHEEADNGGKVGVHSLLVNVSERVAERQFSFPRNLLKGLPEFVLHSQARLVPANPN
jgi:hypothetical protein